MNVAADDGAHVAVRVDDFPECLCVAQRDAVEPGAAHRQRVVMHGDEDVRVHPAQGMEFFRALKTLGVPVRFVRYPREKHSFVERAHQIDLMTRIVDWFITYLR